MAVDPGLMMALSVHAHKGVYAVLLGSGVSRSAGIPTGWDVVKNLIERLAAVRGIAKVEDAEAWYRKEFGKEPNYSELVEVLAPKPPERMSLLKEFFEPTAKEREEGLKVPTDAHRAIARLVARGYIRVIVTTNFDKLMERAIEAEGVTPTIVSSADGIAGMMPLPHVRCLIVKVHGDYLDTRIKNTPAELSAYDAETNTLLERIFSEYGLLVCGWSGDWDPALAEVIRRSTRHRFSTYWMHRGKLSDRAAELARHRQAILIPIEAADKAFADLDVRVEALEAQRVADPISPRIALAMTKRFLSESRFQIQLQDLVIGELTTIRRQLTADRFPIGQPQPDKEPYRARVEQLEALCGNLAPMVAAGVYWGDGTTDRLWFRCVESLARSPAPVSGTVYPAWTRLMRYPATIIVYSAGLAAMQRNRLDWLKQLLYDTFIPNHSSGIAQPIGEVVGAELCIMRDAGPWLHNGSQRSTPGSDRLVAQLQPMLVDVLGEDIEFEKAFDEFEFLLSLVRADLTGRALPGRFCWRDGVMRDQVKQIKERDANHPFYLAGMFGRSTERLSKSVSAVNEMPSGRW